MKRTFFIMLPILFGLLACAQKKPVLNGYAFQRVTLPAVRTTAIAEGTGAEIQKPNKEKITSFIFIEHKTGVVIKPSILWLHGIPYQVNYEPVKDQTVIISRNSVTGRLIPDTLVRKSANQVLSISPTSRADIPKPSGMSGKITSKNAVLEYYVKGKKYYHIIPSIKKLEPLALQ